MQKLFEEAIKFVPKRMIGGSEVNQKFLYKSPSLDELKSTSSFKEFGHVRALVVPEHSGPDAKSSLVAWDANGAVHRRTIAALKKRGIGYGEYHPVILAFHNAQKNVVGYTGWAKWYGLEQNDRQEFDIKKHKSAGDFTLHTARLKQLLSHPDMQKQLKAAFGTNNDTVVDLPIRSTPRGWRR